MDHSKSTILTIYEASWPINLSQTINFTSRKLILAKATGCIGKRCLLATGIEE